MSGLIRSRGSMSELAPSGAPDGGEGPRASVLHVIKGLGPGGAERLLVAFLGAADREAFRHAVVYLLDTKRHLAEAIEATGAEVVPLRVDSVRDLRWLYRIGRVIREVGPDIIHVHSPVPAAAVRVLSLLLSLRRGDRPTIVSTEHNTWRSYRLPTRLANALTYPVDVHHFAVSREVRNSVWRRWRPDTEILIHGVDLPALRARRDEGRRVRAELDLDDTAIVVVTVANYRVDKDYPTLLAAAAAASAKRDDIVFVVIGQGPLEREVRAEAERLHLSTEQLRLLGFRADAVDVIAAGDIFLLASAQEGLPVALMEALVLGKPVVSTAVGGIPDAVEHGVQGLLVPRSRPDLLAAGVVELAGDPVRRQAMGEAARRRGQAFDIERSARRYEAVYASFVKGPG